MREQKASVFGELKKIARSAGILRRFVEMEVAVGYTGPLDGTDSLRA
jgi:hypothetical protein